MSIAKHIADHLGQANIAASLKVGVTAVNNAVSREYFPATWFPVIRQMCAKAGLDCPESAFNFKSPSSVTSSGDPKYKGSLPSKKRGDAATDIQGRAAS